jgi:hypothetical protein
MAIDLFVADTGQSNDYSFTGYDISGAPGANASASGADFGLKINTPFAAVLMNQMLNQAPATPPATQTFAINTGDVSLQNFAAAGQFNAGHEQAARLLVSLGIAANPYWTKMAIGSTSVPGHWAKLSGFPAGAGTSLYQQRITYLAARIAAAGRPPDVFVHRIGETDSSTPSRVLSAPIDLKQWYDDTCNDLGIALNIPIIAVYLNQHAALNSPDVAGYNAAMDAWAALDPRVSLIKIDDLFLRSDPHYALNEQWKIGQRIVVEIARRLRPGLNLSRGTGPLPFYQSAGPLCTSQGGTSPSIPDAGERPQPGDLDVAYALSYTQATTHTFTQPATGTPYTQVGTQVDSVLSTSHQAMTVWWRILQPSDIDSSGRTVGPTITFGSATLNRAKRVIIPKAHPTAPIAGFLTGVNNANTTALTIGASPVTVPAGCMALVIVGSAKSGGGQSVATVTNASLSGYSTIYDGEANPGAGVVHSAFGTAAVTGTSMSPTTVAFSQLGINVGFALAIAPAPAASGTVTTRSRGDFVEFEVTVSVSADTTFTVPDTILAASPSGPSSGMASSSLLDARRLTVAGFVTGVFSDAAGPTSLDSHFKVNPGDVVNLTAIAGGATNVQVNGATVLTVPATAVAGVVGYYA